MEDYTTYSRSDAKVSHLLAHHFGLLQCPNNILEV